MASMTRVAILLCLAIAVVVNAKVAKKGDGFDGFGTPDPFNQNDDDQVDAGEPNAPDQENPNDDANMVSDDDADDDDSFVQLGSKVAKKGDGFDGFGTPDPFNQNDDDQVDAGEPNAPDQENPNDDANMVSDDDADDDDSFVQVGSKVAKKGDGFDGFGTPDPFNQNDDDQVDAGEPNAPDQENPNDDANMVSDDDADDDDSFVQVSRNIDDDNAEAAEMAHLEAQSDKDMGEDDDDAKTDGDEEKSEDESFVQVSRNIDDDNAEAAEMARLEAQSDKDMGEDDDETKSSDDDDKSDDESFVQVSSKKGDGFDGFGTPDPFNQNDDDQVDAGEPNAPDQENPNDDANMVSDDDADDDDSFVQVGSKVAKKGDGFDGFGTPDPFNQNDDDQVDAGEPNAPDQENPNDDANMVSDDDADDDDSFIQVSRNIDDDNAEAAEMARLEAQSDKDMGEDDDESKTDGDDEEKSDNDSFVQLSRNIDDDNAEAAEMARLEAQSDKDMGEDDDETKSSEADDRSDDESFVQVSSKKGDGFDGFGTPDPFNQNDDDQVDAGEPNAPDQENPNDDANMVSDDDADDDDSFVQKVASKRFLSRANATK